MSWFSRSPEAKKPTEATEAKPVEKKLEVRKAPTAAEYAQMAEARKAKSKEKWGAKLKGWGEAFKKGVNYVFSVPDRIATRYHQAGDLGAIGAHKGAEAARATGRGIKAVGEYAVDTGVAAGVAVGKKIDQIDAAGNRLFDSVDRGFERAGQKFTETRTRIAESFRDKRNEIMGRMEMRNYQKAEGRIEANLRKIAELQDSVGRDRDLQKQIEEKLNARGYFNEGQAGEAAAA